LYQTYLTLNAETEELVLFAIKMSTSIIRYLNECTFVGGRRGK
jgi:hypothetical protein